MKSMIWYVLPRDTYISLKPKDQNHPYGHGKIEFLSASLEGFLIILAGLIVWEKFRNTSTVERENYVDFENERRPR